MTKTEWLKSAEKLQTLCASKVQEKNGSKPCTQKEANDVAALNHVVGSAHGNHIVVYKALGESLTVMINLVKAGKKDDKFSDVKKK